MTYYGAGDTNAGALKAITYPKGAKVGYTYQQTQLPLCSRSKTVPSPWVGATPRVWFGPDYAVTAWYSEGVLNFEIYTWLGRWQRSHAQVPLGATEDPTWRAAVIAHPQFRELPQR